MLWIMGTFSVQMVMRGRVESPPHHYLHAKSAHALDDARGPDPAL